ncbi:hypothetical protein [Streptomyces sp. NPDC005827]|uniref:hypothetical protein n=1 Tax=Streptomyces sp. NPDC005827 TaxID=3157070 RepID=UPI0033DC2223
MQYVQSQIGAEIPCSRIAINSEFEYQGKTLTVDFHGGLRYRADVDPDDPTTGVRLRIIGWRVAAESEMGAIVLEQNDVGVGPKSRVHLTLQFPPVYEVRETIGFTATISTDDSPVVLTTKEDVVVLCPRVTQFPPRGDLYKLEKAVELVDPKAPDTVVGRLLKFDAKTGGL